MPFIGSRTRKRQRGKLQSQHPPCWTADPHGVNTGAPTGVGRVRGSGIKGMSLGSRGRGRERGVREDWQCAGYVRGPAELGLSPPGFSSPCSFMAAVSGANSSILWERPAAQDGGLVLCDMAQPRDSGATSACILVGSAGSFIAVNSSTGRPVPSAPPWATSGGGQRHVL